MSFSCLLVCLLIFLLLLLNGGHDVLELGTEVNRPLGWGFMLIWPGVRLCLNFPIDVDSRVLKFLYCSCFSLLHWLLTSLGTLPQESLHFVALSAVNQLFYWSPVCVVVRHWGGEEFYNLMIKSQSLREPVSLRYNLWKYSLATIPAFSDTRSLKGAQMGNAFFPQVG